MNKQQMFELVANKENWKLPTNPYSTRDRDFAEKLAEAIIYYVGGATISSIGINGLDFVVSSKGYYHYIGA